MNKLLIVILILITAASSFAGGFLLDSLINPRDVREQIYINQCTDHIECQYSNTKNYFLDRIVLSGKDNDGQQFLIEARLSRTEQEEGRYSHYYDFDIIASGQTYNYNLSQNITDRDVFPSGFVADFSNKVNIQNTSETYHIKLNTADNDIDINIAGLKGDFIVKNDYAYTRYHSVGLADIKVDNESFTVNAMTSKIYSPDYSKYIFFPGFQELESVNHHLVLWDDQSNFYMIDTAEVEVPSPYYDSHIWVLYKNFNTAQTHKFFKAELAHTLSPEGTRRWDISLPELATTFELTANASFVDNAADGSLTGTVEDAQGVRKIIGSFKTLGI